MPKYCPDCGRENPDYSTVCPECADSLDRINWGSKTLLFNRYELLEAVKSGAMGCVYRARDIQTGEVVAVKKMLASYADDEDKDYVERRFRSEAKLLMELKHSGIPRIINFFETKDPDSAKSALFLVMTFIEGKDLASIMRERGNRPLSLYCALNIFQQILDILIYLHSRNPPIVYRDMKASNIMVQYPFWFADPYGDERENIVGKVFLVDFGIARFFAPGKKGTMIGTPGYAAPEQYTGYAEPRSDIYSLGVVMHYLLTGVDPEEHEHPTFVHEPVRNLNPDVPEFLHRIICSMVELVVEKRPQSAEKIRKKLDDEKIIIKKSDLKAVMDFNRRFPNYAFDKTSMMPYVRGRDEHGMTALHRAVMRGDLANVEILIRAGADVNAVCDYKWTPFLIAIDRGHIDIAQVLIQWGADVNAKNSDGKTALHLATFRGNKNAVRTLLEWGADVNATLKDGSTPLHIAAGQGQVSVAALLVEEGAWVNAKDSSGMTPLDVASHRGRKEMVKFLLNLGADINSKDNVGWTALHWASSSSKKEVAELLLSKGANIDAEDREEITPLDLAKRRKDKGTAYMLKRRGAREKSFWEEFMRNPDF